jgi:hypothetical protein
VKFSRKEVKASLESSRRVFNQEEKKRATEFVGLQKREAIEEQVHEASSSYLEKKYEELQKLTDYWDSKYEQDIEEQESILQNLKSRKAADVAKLVDLKQKYKELQEWLGDYKKKSESKQLIKNQEQIEIESAIRIQQEWRKYKAVKKAKDQLRKLKKGRSKSPKKK